MQQCFSGAHELAIDIQAFPARLRPSAEVAVETASLLEQINCKPVSSISLRRKRDRQRVIGCAMRTGYRECPISIGSPNTVCVDTQHELEYCGSGCTNCLDMEGAENVVCESGGCVALTCGAGWTIEADRCVRRGKN